MPQNRRIQQKHDEWNLLTNVPVEVCLDGKVVRTGFVEEVMPDSSAIWLASDARNARQLFEVCEGYEVWVTPRELEGALTYRMTAQHLFEPAQLRTARRFPDLPQNAPQMQVRSVGEGPGRCPLSRTLGWKRGATPGHTRG